MSDRDNRSLSTSLRSLGWPLVVGMAAYFAFLLSIKKGIIAHALVIRYFAGHPVSHVTTAMFLVGMAALVIKAFELLAQYHALGQIRLEVPPPSGQQIADCDRLLGSLKNVSRRLHATYFWRRLHDALLYVQRKRAAEGLDEELKYLADLDAARQQDSFSLVRILIWATPMLGFLGTVIGITMALEDFGKQDFRGENLNQAMEVLLSGLYVAFDTTALALSLSVVLMFVQFVIDRFETLLLGHVDSRAAEQLVGRFEELGGAADPNVRSVERMCRSVVRASEQLVQRQGKLWEATIDEAHQRWSKLSDSATESMQKALTIALSNALQTNTERMAKIGHEFGDQLRQRWEHWQVVMSDNARILNEQQKEMFKQSEIMKQVLATVGDVINLEKLLNDNLKLLAGSKNFEDTVMSLAAAIHLLNTRLGQLSDAPRVELGKPVAKGYAA